MMTVSAILDGAAVAAASFSGDMSDPRSYLLTCYPQATIAPLGHVVLTAEPLLARVNHGIWIASCSCGVPRLPGVPTPGMIVFLDVLLGWCVRCGNQAWGRGWRRVVAPPPEERQRIEAVLLLRPNVEDRNWESTETVADLIAQNLAHGDLIPPPDEPPSVAPVPAGPRPSRFPPPSVMAAMLGRFKRQWR